MIFEFKSPEGKTYEVEGPEGSSPEEAFQKLQEHLKTPDTNTNLNRARVVGTAAVGELGNLATIPHQILQGMDWLRGKLDPENAAKHEESRRERERDAPSVKDFIENKLGLPTDPGAEAKRLGVTRDPNLKAIEAGAKMAAGMGALGAGRRATALTALGAGVGHATGGEAGELAGAFAGPLVAGKLASRAAARKAGPTTEELGKKADDAFAQMRQADAVVSESALARLGTRIEADLARQSFTPSVHTQTATIAKELGDLINKGPASYTLAGGLSRAGVPSAVKFDQLHGFRQVVNEGIKNSVPASADARLLSRIKSKLDDFLSNLTQADAVSGNPLKAAAALKEGTAAYRQYAKSQEIAQLMEKARNNAPGFSQTGMDKAVRDQFKSLANSERRMRLFTPSERAQIRMIAKSTKAMNLVRFFGRMSPKGALTGVAHTAAIAANPAIGLPIAGALSAARVVATRSREKAVKDLDEIIRLGQRAPVPPALPLALPGLGMVGANYLSRE
jgi:hypothetical protein